MIDAYVVRAGVGRSRLPRVKIVLFKGSGKQPWRFKLVAGNGEVVAQSEGYFSRWNLRRAVKKFGLPVEDQT